ncbi:hypothetical protein G195_010782 [Phytophthora kernoviae 00238/432]|uniref:Uncharacterized protein n=1 Tax=Phytophthora kernoviae 00238/432 TaxID=1284355 RepID=A0A8J4S3I3_9STRA|nr:hypothetical protein G195_010782 [Phytophthora kernoviae 00238/432]
MDDLKPEMVILNAEIFHALFVSWCMQRSASTYTTVLLMVMDFVEATLALRDVGHIMKGMNNVLALNAKIDDLSRGKESDIRQVTQPPDNVLKCSNDDSDVPIVNSYAKNLVDEMSSTERLRYLRSALQVLHIAEFLVLVEMTEVIIPVVYCIYLSIVYHLPNKVYYAQLRGVDDATLQHNLLNVMTYSLLELVSFVMLSYVLQRKVGVSTLRQLAFVMGSQWQVAQCKFVLWVVHSVQAPLDHFGADFSFKFQWLHGNTSSIMGE